MYRLAFLSYTPAMTILGIDEVGRGPWAGPLVVGAVVLKNPIDGLTDSKKLSKKRREELVELIHANSVHGLGWVSAPELDEIGLSQALRLATRRAVQQINYPHNEIIIDGTINFLSDTAKAPFVTTLKKADLLIPAVSAASILAKVARDEYMTALAQKYPEYHFGSHVGYGTAKHRSALLEFGVTPEHRKSFAPIAKLLGVQSPRSDSSNRQHDAHAKNTTRVGRIAEAKVADFLGSEAHQIVALNWKTPHCEIDIISIKDDKIYFTEVKYRQNSTHGDGFAAITPQKLRAINFAAESFLQLNKISNLRPILQAAAVHGKDYIIDDIIEL